MNAQRRNELIAVYRNGLLEDTLPFWLPRCVDEEHGGFMIARDRDGGLLDTDKGMWQQCRFTWLLATLYNTVEPREEWLAAARHGIEFIEKHGFDANDGDGDQQLGKCESCLRGFVCFHNIHIFVSLVTNLRNRLKFSVLLRKGL